MAKYSDIKGFTVQTLSTDTVSNTGATGAWSSGGNMNTARYTLAGVGTQTQALGFGGRTPSYVCLLYTSPSPRDG